jgi:hypothetical protein
MWAVLLSLISAVALVALGNLRIAAPAAVSVMVVWGAAVCILPRPTAGLRHLVMAALLVRVVLMAAEPSLSDDVYRYLWEGHVAIQGGNPYLHPPADPIWDGLGLTEIRAQVNHPEVTAVYPPLAIWFFGILVGIAAVPLSIQVTMGLADVGIAWMLGRILQRRGRTIAPAWLYALHPLGAVESAGSGHIEAVGVLCMLLAIDAWDRRESGAGWAMAGAMVKFLPAALLPRLWRKRPWLLALGALVALITVLPFADAGTALLGGLSSYVSDWRFNGLVYSGLELLIGDAARWLLLLVGLMVVVRAIRIHWLPERIALWAGGVFVVLSPTVHPWYLLWAWVPALLCGVRSWTLFATMMPLSYLVFLAYDPATRSWEEQWWLPVLTTLPFLLALTWESVRHGTLPGPWGPGRAQTGSPSRSRTAHGGSILPRP